MSQESNEIASTLRAQAAEIANEGHAGWGNTMTWAADHIDALSAVVERQREALKKVIAISDRKHEAWDEAKEALALTPATALVLHDAEVLEQWGRGKQAKMLPSSYHTDFGRGVSAAYDAAIRDAGFLRSGGEG